MNRLLDCVTLLATYHNTNKNSIHIIGIYIHYYILKPQSDKRSEWFNLLILQLVSLPFPVPRHLAQYFIFCCQGSKLST